MGAIDFDLAFMSMLFKVLAVAAFVLLDAAAVNAADCACEHLSAEGCLDQGSAREEPAAPPEWCERMDDPRCMPAGPRGGAAETPVPIAVGWAQTICWKAPPLHGVPVDTGTRGGERTEHSRRVERPPR
jgi:hypothetical protein